MTLSRDQLRFVLKDTIRQQINFAHTDQNRGVPAPPAQKPSAPEDERFPLPSPAETKSLARISLWKAVAQRESHREFLPQSLSLLELSWLLWATQGVKGTLGPTTFRTVPSAGARHPLETYLAVNLIKGLKPGIYRYLPLEHCLTLVKREQGLPGKLTEACLGQGFAGKCAVMFAWTAIPYRTEWRYDRAAHRVILLDAGHVCQNLYLACEAVGCGTCAIGAYNQDGVDQLIGVDGDEEFAIYLASVGRIAAQK